MSNIISRKTFLKHTAASGAGLLFGGSVPGFANSPGPKEDLHPIMSETLKYRKFDAHAHVSFDDSREKTLLDFADRLGIEKMCISFPMTNFSGTEPEDQTEVIRHNDLVIKALKGHPDRFIGYMTLNPRYQRESLEEIDRCVDQGLTGYKGYVQVKINDPLYYPIIERFIDLRMLIFMHAFCQLGMGGYRMQYDIKRFPNTSIPEDFVDISNRYPEAIFQFAHIGGGGDWEYIAKALTDSPNVYVDTSGSNNEEHMMDFAVKHLGEDRLLFGTDGSFYQAVGKILASDLSKNQKKKIFYDNYKGVLKRLGRNAD